MSAAADMARKARKRVGLLGIVVAGLAVALSAQQLNAASAIDRTPARELFGNVKTPVPLKARSIGFYARGCLAGAAALPVNGQTWQVMRLSRNRNWGHPKLIALVERLAEEAKAIDHWNGLLVGDISQPRGGPMLTGHASHQVGLDADIWLTPMPGRVLSNKEREVMQATSVIVDRKTINKAVWSEAHAKLIRRAASYPEVERIFVHPPIKRALCNWAKGDRSWLAKVRPYYNHTYHFHVRIRCPKDSVGCVNQPRPVPEDGTGCGKELAYWFSEKPWAPPSPPQAKPAKPPKPPRQMTLSALPKDCRQLISIK